MATVDPHVFRAYDIRGVYGQNITEEFCHLVGKGFGSELRERYNKEHPTVIVGRDARTHSPSLEAALIEGLISTGCHVKTIGETPSPVNYFALCHLECDGSVQVTASHNDKEDNGLKLQLRDAEAFSGEELQGLLKRIQEERFVEGSSSAANAASKDKEGSYEEIEIVTAYQQKVLSLAPIGKGMTVAVDFGNGVSGPIYSQILENAGVHILPLYAEPDGTFPNHIADPTKHETLKDLQALILKEGADCGLAFDGDGDRVGFVDEAGNVVSADNILLLLAKDHIQRNPKATVVYTVSMSSALETEVEKMGGKGVMCIVGHSFVEHAMRDNDSHLGGEQSGHFFCGEDYYDFDDALVTALRVLSIFSLATTQDSKTPIAKTPNNTSLESSSLGVLGSFSNLFKQFPQTYQTPEWRPHCEDARKTEIVKEITEHFEKHYPCITIDGVRIDCGEGAWAGVRQSNTSPKLSICMEARSEEKLKEIERIVKEHLRTYPEIE